MSDVNLSISQEVVRPIIEAKVQAAIVSQLVDHAKMMEDVVCRVLGAKVDDEGKQSYYAREKTYLQWLCESAVKQAALDAVKKATEEMKPELQKLITACIHKQKAQIASTMVGYLIEQASHPYNIRTQVTFESKKND